MESFQIHWRIIEVNYDYNKYVGVLRFYSKYIIHNELTAFRTKDNLVLYKILKYKTSLLKHKISQLELNFLRIGHELICMNVLILEFKMMKI